MNIDARTQRTILRLLSVFLAAGAGDAIIQFSAGATSYDWRHLAAALVAAAALGLEQFLKNSGDNAPPTVAAVNDALKPAMPTIVAGIAPTLTAVSTVPSRTVAPPSQSRAG